MLKEPEVYHISFFFLFNSSGKQLHCDFYGYLAFLETVTVIKFNFPKFNDSGRVSV